MSIEALSTSHTPANLFFNPLLTKHPQHAQETMKLNVLSESNPSTTPALSTVPPSPSPSPHRRHATGTQTEPPTWGIASTLRYALAISVFLALPFCLPLAITQALRVLERPQSLPSTLREIRHTQVNKPGERDWSKWAVVRNGRLFISETFENRLNAHVGRVYTGVRERFRGDCEGGDIGFAFNRGDRIRGWVEVTMKCGYGTCVRRADVEDVRRLIVGVRDGLHYVTAGRKVWGPLRGRMRVGLDADGQLGVRRVCDGVVERVDVDVRKVRAMVGEAVDVFRFDAGR